jgi:hypothetical protein
MLFKGDGILEPLNSKGLKTMRMKMTIVTRAQNHLLLKRDILK